MPIHRPKDRHDFGELAQMGEHLLCKQGVSGSIPLFSINTKVLIVTWFFEN